MKKISSTQTCPESPDTPQAKDDALWRQEHGPLFVRLTNDYLFRAMAQYNNASILRRLVCSVLGMDINEIKDLEILNPIELGKSLSEKEFILDTKVRLNNDITIDMEMQVIDYHDWPERSLQYLCRAFDSLHKGDNYTDTGTAVHVGILDYTLFPDSRSSMRDTCS